MLVLTEKSLSYLKNAKVTDKQMNYILTSNQVKDINMYFENNHGIAEKAATEIEAFEKFMKKNYSILPAKHIKDFRNLLKKVGDAQVLWIELGKNLKNALYFFGNFNLPELHDVSEVKTNKGIRTVTRINDNLYVHYYSTDYAHHYFVQLDQHKLNDDNTIVELNYEEVDKEFVVYYPPVSKGFALHYSQVKETFEDVKELLDKHQTVI